MPRIVPFPTGLRFTSRVPISGPRSVVGASNESLTGFVQTVQSLSGLWSWQFTLTPMRGPEAIAYRGFVTALHNGANATAVPFRDPDTAFADMGLTFTAGELRNGLAWSDGSYWSTGQGWNASFGLVDIAASAAKGATVVRLADESWANRLGVGHRLGFGPFYFGLHEITEVVTDRTFRVWPPLRAALTAASYATLEPVMAMRLAPGETGVPARGISATEAATITFYEIEDADIRAVDASGNSVFRR